MSRVGKKPITIPSGVTVTIHDQEVEVKGPKGTLRTPIPAGVSFRQEDGALIAERGFFIEIGRSSERTIYLHPVKHCHRHNVGCFASISRSGAS